MTSFVLLLLLVIGITVARARHEGFSWDDVFAWPSKWFYWVILGGVWGPTFCACVGLHVRDGVRYVNFWLRWQLILDYCFSWREEDHCERSLERTEEYLSGRKLPPNFRWGHKATTKRSD